MAFMLVGDDGVWNVRARRDRHADKETGTDRQSFHRF